MSDICSIQEEDSRALMLFYFILLYCTVKGLICSTSGFLRVKGSSNRLSILLVVIRFLLFQIKAIKSIPSGLVIVENVCIFL